MCDRRDFKAKTVEEMDQALQCEFVCVCVCVCYFYENNKRPLLLSSGHARPRPCASLRQKRQLTRVASLAAAP